MPSLAALRVHLRLPVPSHDSTLDHRRRGRLYVYTTFTSPELPHVALAMCVTFH